MRTNYLMSLFVLMFLLACCNLAFAQVPPKTSQVALQPQQATLTLTVRAVDEKGNPSQDRKIQILITDADCSCVFDTNCKNKTCVECCQRARPIENVTVKDGILSKEIEIDPGNQKIIILDNDEGTIYESKPITVMAGEKINIKVPLLRPYGSPAIDKGQPKIDVQPKSNKNEPKR